MTTLMAEALKECETLPDGEQNWLARMLLDTIRDEQHWDRQFAASQDVLGEMADEALTAFEAGRTIPLS